MRLLDDADVGACLFYLSADAPLSCVGGFTLDVANVNSRAHSMQLAMKTTRDERRRVAVHRRGNGYALGALPLRRCSLQASVRG